MNRFVSSITTLSVVTVLAGLTGGCEAQKSENPLSPSVAGPIPGVNISAPRLLEPAQGFKFKENQQPIKLVIENSNTNGVRPITYIFEVAADSGFATKVFARSGVVPGEGGRTSVQVDALELGRSYYWRARAEDGANNSVFSSAEFSVLPRAMLTVPSPASPVNGETLATRRPTLFVNNATRNEAVGPVRLPLQHRPGPGVHATRLDNGRSRRGRTDAGHGRSRSRSLHHPLLARVRERRRHLPLDGRRPPPSGLRRRPAAAAAEAEAAAAAAGAAAPTDA